MSDEINNILEKVTWMYLKYGIKSVTMDDVSRELGISKKTLYQYFSDKNDLVHKTVDSATERIENEFRKIFDLNLNAIEEILEVNKLGTQIAKEHSDSADYDLKKYYPDLYEKILKARKDGMYDMVIQNMKKGKVQGIYRKDLNEEVIAKLYVSRMMAMTDNFLFSHDELISKEVFREIFVYHIHGIANAKGLEILEKNLKKNEITI